MINRSVIKDYNCNVNFWLILLFGAAIGVFLIGMPKYMDDGWYAINLADWFYKQNVPDITEGGNIFKYGIPWEGIIKTWHEHWLEDNIRLGNLLVVFFLLLPKWVGSGIALIVWMYAMIVSYKLARIDVLTSPIVLLGLIMWGIFMPWSNYMGVLDFQFNYLLGTGVALCFIYHILRQSGEGKSNLKNGSLETVGLFVLGILTGMWHEGFSIPILIGFLVLLLSRQMVWNPRVLWGLGGLLIGILILFCTPGTYVRLTESMDPAVSHHKFKELRVVINNLSYYIFLLICLIVGVRKDLKSIRKDRIIIFIIVNGCVPILMSVILYAEGRVTWWTQIVSIIGIMYILNKYSDIYWKKYELKNVIWLGPLALLMFAHLIISDYYVIKMSNSLRYSIKQFVNNPDASVFTEVITVKDQPLICFKMPDVLFYGGQIYRINDVLKEWTDNKLKMIPEELRNTTSDSGEKIDGPLNARMYNGRIFMKEEDADFPEFVEILFETDFGKGTKNVYGYSFSFKSEKDGRQYRYIHLMSSWHLQHFGKLKALRLNQ